MLNPPDAEPVIAASALVVTATIHDTLLNAVRSFHSTRIEAPFAGTFLVQK